jgi:hypothetical protein
MTPGNQDTIRKKAPPANRQAAAAADEGHDDPNK